MTHELKILPCWFEDILDGNKDFEIRENDRDFKVGDLLILKEWNGKAFTGRNLTKRIKYIHYGTGEYGIAKGFCILGLAPYQTTVVE